MPDFTPLDAFLKRKQTATILLACGLLYSLSPWSGSASAMILGVVLAIVCGNPYADRTKLYAQKLLAYSIIGLGAGMNLVAVAAAGASGLAITILSISLTFFLGLLIGRVAKADRETSTLISIGTAICGGSAIAAIAPVIRAKPQAITVALGSVFMLNALALIMFPAIGHYFDLTQHQFGLWSALAIHDTSSVVGAGLQYGPDALQEAVTIKLARALWIVPLTFGFGYFYRDATTGQKPSGKKPWFILGFLLMAALVTWVPGLQAPGHVVDAVARRCLIVTLFLIGSNLTFATLKQVGVRPFLQALSLWLIVSAVSLAAIKYWVTG